MANSTIQPALQWQIDNNDTNGGIISFGSNGEGMHFFNVDTTDYIPNEDLGEVEDGLELTGLELHSSAFGGRSYQLNFEIGSSGELGDFNGDGLFDANDLNELAAAIRAENMDGKYDVTGDGIVDNADHTAWVKTVRNTWVGDSNLDGEFNSTDFVVVFTPALYETGNAAQWETGDWDGDGVFNSSDFVAAFVDGGYEKGPVPVVANQIPEPSGLILVSGTLLLLIRRRR